MDHVEISHNDRRHEFVDEVRPLMNEVIDVLHDDKVLAAGEKMTITMTYDCGFRGRIIFEVDDVGGPHLG